MPTVFAIACHPDDIEFTMAGTMLLMKQRGCDLHYMTIANGSWGTATMRRDEIIAARRGEAAAAAAMMGATFHEPLVDDLEVFYERKTLLRLIAAVREVKPDIVLLQSPVDYMEDHQNAVRLGVTAVFCRGMVNAPCEPPTEPTFQDVTIYHALPHGTRDPMRRVVRAERYVDIGPVMAKKRELLACHKSQKEWLDVSQGYDSYLDSMTEAGEIVGKLCGKYTYVEGWRRHNHVGLSAREIDPMADILGDVSWVDPAYEKYLRGE